MLIDYRQHILTLVAIFLALGLGVLIGGAIFTDESISRNQEELVDRLEKDFSTLRGENRKLAEDLNLLRANLETERKFADWILPWAIQDRLEGESFALVSQEAIDKRVSRQFSDLLQQSGAKVVAELSVKPKLLADGRPEDFQVLAGILAVGLRGPALVGLEKTGLVQFSASAPVPAGRVLLVGNQADDAGLKGHLEKSGLWVWKAPPNLGNSQEKARFIFDLVKGLSDGQSHGNHPGI